MEENHTYNEAIGKELTEEDEWEEESYEPEYACPNCELWKYDEETGEGHCAIFNEEEVSCSRIF